MHTYYIIIFCVNTYYVICNIGRTLFSIKRVTLFCLSKALFKTSRAISWIGLANY
jgi:hypothetical protein